MANEFIARKGLIVLNNGAKITGSLSVFGDINATGYNITASNLRLSGNADIDGNVNIGGNITVGNADIDVVKFLAEVSSSITPDVNNAFDLGSGSKAWRDLYVSGTTFTSTIKGNNSLQLYPDINDSRYLEIYNTSPTDVHIKSSGGLTFLGDDTTYVKVENTGTKAVEISGSLLVKGTSTFTDNQTVFGNIFLSGSNRLIYNNTNTTSLLFGFFDGSTINGPYYQIFGNNYSNATQRGSAEFVFDTRNSGGSGFNIAGFDGSTWTRRFRVFDGGAEVTGSFNVTNGITGSLLSTNGVVSSSAQIDVTQTTNIATIATTGSNTFTGIQNISNTTNSTTFADGALVVAGGVGIGKDVNISGSLQVLGLLTVVSMSTQYVTSSQYTVGTSRVIVNDDDLVRFAGLSVVDSGSTYGTGSLLWDSFKNHWIYEADDQAYNSAILIAGPKNTGSLGDEIGLISGRVPVASGDDHIDTNPALTPLRIDGGVFHVEGSQYVTGSVTASAFTGDGSQLTGIVTNLNISGSQGGTGTVALKTQDLLVSGTNGVGITVSGQTILVSGSNATTTNRGVASFTGSNFTVTNGEVSSNPINFNGANINLGGTHAFGLQNITPYGATTSDQLILTSGAIIHGVLYASGSNLDVDSGTEIVASVSTGSYDAAFFDYVVKKGVNYRAGTVMAVWDGSNNVEFTDTSTNDLGSTQEVIFTVDILSGVARLKATVDTNDWSIKTIIRAI